MSKKIESTFDKFMKDKNQKELFDKEYNKFMLSEFLLDAMKEEHFSVRKLSEKSGVSTSIIQNIKTEKTSNVTLNTIQALASSMGYRINFEKISQRVQ
ncbi:MAG: helix-turn-helix domain-containing protein [Spirochaetales bacterium]|nr:helix-turn-helix domain-containing protein [Spirochaetales bacterium]